MRAHFVDATVAGERFERLRVVVERSALARHRAASVAARTSCSKVRRKGSDDRHWAQRQNKLVHVRPPRPLRPGTYAVVEIVDAAPHHLRGWFIDVLAEPAHRRRIPVLAG